MKREDCVNFVRMVKSQNINLNSETFSLISEYMSEVNSEELNNKFTQQQLDYALQVMLSNPMIMMSCLNPMAENLRKKFNIFTIYDAAGNFIQCY